MLLAVLAVALFGRNFARRVVALVLRCSAVLGSFDTKVIDGYGVDGVGRLARAISSLSVWCETWMVDGPVKFGAGVIWALSFPVRMIQNGLVLSYMRLIVIGLIGVLGYFIYQTHHAIR